MPSLVGSEMCIRDRCRTRSLVQDPSIAGCPTICCRQDEHWQVGQKVARKKPSGPKLSSFQRIIVLISSESGVNHARASTGPRPRAARACSYIADARRRGLVRGLDILRTSHLSKDTGRLSREGGSRDGLAQTISWPGSREIDHVRCWHTPRRPSGMQHPV